jgi:truncated hemoglobin YjbI
MSFRSLSLALCLTCLVVVGGCKHDDKKPDNKPMTKSLYDRLGGEGAVKVVVHDFVGRAANDPKVNFFRKGTGKEWKPGPGDVEHLEAQLVALIGQLTGGPQKYNGKAMKPLHAGMKITSAEFDAAAQDLIAALNAAGVKPADRDELVGIVASTKKDIVEAP